MRCARNFAPKLRTCFTASCRWVAFLHEVVSSSVQHRRCLLGATSLRIILRSKAIHTRFKCEERQIHAIKSSKSRPGLNSPEIRSKPLTHDSGVEEEYYFQLLSSYLIREKGYSGVLSCSIIIERDGTSNRGPEMPPSWPKVQKLKLHPGAQISLIVRLMYTPYININSIAIHCSKPSNWVAK